MEDDDSRMHIRNLSAHRTTNEEEALNLVRLCGYAWSISLPAGPLLL
jgi:hypothetical protein